MVNVDMDDLEQTLIFVAQDQETIGDTKDLENELLDWKDWTKAIEAIQEEDGIMQFAESYYSSTGTALKTEDLENLLNESDKMDETTEETLNEVCNI